MFLFLSSPRNLDPGLDPDIKNNHLLAREEPEPLSSWMSLICELRILPQEDHDHSLLGLRGGEQSRTDSSQAGQLWQSDPLLRPLNLARWDSPGEST